MLQALILVKWYFSAYELELTGREELPSHETFGILTGFFSPFLFRSKIETVEYLLRAWKTPGALKNISFATNAW